MCHARRPLRRLQTLRRRGHHVEDRRELEIRSQRRGDAPQEACLRPRLAPRLARADDVYGGSELPSERIEKPELRRRRTSTLAETDAKDAEHLRIRTDRDERSRAVAAEERPWPRWQTAVGIACTHDAPPAPYGLVPDEGFQRNPPQPRTHPLREPDGGFQIEPTAGRVDESDRQDRNVERAREPARESGEPPRAEARFTGHAEKRRERREAFRRERRAARRGGRRFGRATWLPAARLRGRPGASRPRLPPDGRRGSHARDATAVAFRVSR